MVYINFDHFFSTSFSRYSCRSIAPAMLHVCIIVLKYRPKKITTSSFSHGYKGGPVYILQTFWGPLSRGHRLYVLQNFSQNRQFSLFLYFTCLFMDFTVFIFLEAYFPFSIFSNCDFTIYRLIFFTVLYIYFHNFTV